METSFYHDSGQGTTMKSMKSKMTLDFAAPPTKKTKTQTLGVNSAAVLASPDLQMLKLASPELERLIIQHNDMVTTTPTPTSVSYPKNVTEEQEAYARGFVDALAELHKKKEDPIIATTNPSEEIMVPGIPTVVTSGGAVNTDGPHLGAEPVVTYTSMMPSSLPESAMTTTTSLPPMASLPMGPVPLVNHQAVLSDDSRTSSPLMVIPGGIHIKEEPQTVPVMGANPESKFIPIDMGSQEVIKVERKRARNRQAARKCRTRKLERISRLEDRVDELKGQNSDLVNTAQTLREQVCQLKQQILQHVTSGCKVMTPQNN